MIPKGNQSPLLFKMRNEKCQLFHYETENIVEIPKNRSQWQFSVTVASIFFIFFEQSYDMTPFIALKEGNFSQYVVGNFSQYVNSTIASPSFVSVERHRWRGIWKNSSLYLQLQSAVHPVTAKIRYRALKYSDELHYTLR